MGFFFLYWFPLRHERNSIRAELQTCAKKVRSSALLLLIQCWGRRSPQTISSPTLHFLPSTFASAGSAQWLRASFHRVIQILDLQLAQRVTRRFEVIRQLLGYCFAKRTVFSVTTTNCSGRLLAWQANNRLKISILDLARSSDSRSNMIS